MTIPLILALAAALPVTEEAQSPFAAALSYETPWIARGQSPDAGGPLLYAPSGESTSFYQQPGIGGDPYAQGYPGPLSSDPWANGGVAPYAAPNPAYGVIGPQPHQFGLRNSAEIGFMPSGNVSAPGLGSLNMLAVDVESRLTSPVGPGWVFQMAPQFNYRSFDGPNSSLGGPELPGSAYQIGMDFVLQTPAAAGWSYEFAFNPHVGTDFQKFSGDSIMYDGRAVAYWTWGPRLTWAFGAQYWDRVDDIVIPYAGIIWTPNQLWELQLVFPKPKVSVFLGTPLGVATWMYASAEYHVEAYDIQSSATLASRRVQFQDWRVVGGLRWDTGWVQSFAEAGYIFDRNIEEQRGFKYDVGSGFIGRVGFKF